MTDVQTISAGRGVATFVPAGRAIKIAHSHELQSIDLWAFVLSKPAVRDHEDSGKKESQASTSNGAPKKAPIKKKPKDSNLPSQEDAEKAMKQHFESANDQPDPAQKTTWASYVPSLGFGEKKDEQANATANDADGETEQQKDSRTWALYIPTGKVFGSYIPSMAKDTMSDFAKQVSAGTRKLSEIIILPTSAEDYGMTDVEQRNSIAVIHRSHTMSRFAHSAIRPSVLPVYLRSQVLDMQPH
jgi:hypothetical protein